MGPLTHIFNSPIQYPGKILNLTWYTLWHRFAPENYMLRMNANDFYSLHFAHIFTHLLIHINKYRHSIEAQYSKTLLYSMCDAIANWCSNNYQYHRLQHHCRSSAQYCDCCCCCSLIDWSLLNLTAKINNATIFCLLSVTK